MSELREDLIAARALISEPSKWTRNPTSTNPMCAYAAVMKATGALDRAKYGYRAYIAQRFLSQFLPGEFAGEDEVIRFNDHEGTTHADVMALFDRAISATAPT